MFRDIYKNIIFLQPKQKPLVATYYLQNYVQSLYPKTQCPHLAALQTHLVHHHVSGFDCSASFTQNALHPLPSLAHCLSKRTLFKANIKSYSSVRDFLVISVRCSDYYFCLNLHGTEFQVPVLFSITLLLVLVP